MSKWVNKRKVSFLSQPSLKPPTVAGEDEFERLFLLAFRCFRMFGLTPGAMVKQKDRYVVRNTRWMMMIVLVLVASAWVALFETFLVETRTALITGIANHIQFIMNTIALTAAWVGPQLKATDLGAILDGFLSIDRELSSYNVPDVPSRGRSSFLVHFELVILALGLLTSYDGYVSLGTLQTVEVWYWLSHQVPFIVYSMAILHAYVLICWLHSRFRQLNSLIERYYQQGHRQTVQVFQTSIKMEPDDLHRPGTIERKELYNDLQVLGIVSRTIDLGQRIESYFGPLFLTVYTALFSVTTIQSYYCYLHLTSTKAQGLSTESLVLSGGIILSNVVAIVALPYACEQVESESKLLMSVLSKLSMKHGRTAQHSSIWFPNLISSVRFSALGFFTVNYNMLSGLVAGMVTYLIIFIQFNSMVPAEKDDVHQSRKHTIPKERM